MFLESDTEAQGVSKPSKVNRLQRKLSFSHKTLHQISTSAVLLVIWDTGILRSKYEILVNVVCAV